MIAREQCGKVHIVGAGPGAPELLTIKALTLLRAADLVLHDDLVSTEIVSLAGPHTKVINVGKRCGPKAITQAEINALMISSAQEGFDVVRLKSGDPSIFGRLADEVDALSEAGVPFEIVPGITAAMAAAASVAVPLTERQKSPRLLIASGHHANDIGLDEGIAMPEPLAPETTLAIYMPGRDLKKLTSDLLASGLAPTTPCVVISRISMPNERRFVRSLRELHDMPEIESPSIMLVGKVLQRAGRNCDSEMLASNAASPSTDPAPTISERAQRRL